MRRHLDHRRAPAAHRGADRRRSSSRRERPAAGALPAARPLRRPHRVDCATPRSSGTPPPRGLAVVMPAVDRSFYANEAHGHRYWDYVSEELPQVVGQFFRVSPGAGGHVRRRAVDGRVRRAQARAHPPRPVRRRRLAVRRARPGAPVSRRPTASRPVRPGLRRPGRADATTCSRCSSRGRRTCRRCTSPAAPRTALVDGNQRFVAAAEAQGVDVTTDFRPGEHEWGLWDAVIREVIDWLPIACRSSLGRY